MKPKFTHDWQRQFFSLIITGTLVAVAFPDTIAAPGAEPSLKKDYAKAVSTRKVLAWQISGRVTSPSGDALPGVTVLLKGTTTGATTNPNGEYSLNVPE